MCLIGRYDRILYYPRFLDSTGAGDDHTSLFPERTGIHTFVFSVGAPTRRVLNVRDICGTLPVSTSICRYNIRTLSTATNGRWRLLLDFGRDGTVCSSCRIELYHAVREPLYQGS
jgi:hypothetical protein